MRGVLEDVNAQWKIGGITTACLCGSRKQQTSEWEDGKQ
jgi:hypothetical protein